MKQAPTTGTKNLTERQRRNFGVSKYAPREREPNEALGTQVNKMAGTYQPPAWPVRDRSLDHQRIKSRGM